MKRQVAALLVVFHLVTLWPVMAHAVPVAPIIYTAFRIGTQSYALSRLAELGQSLVGQTIKQIDASLEPLTVAALGSGATTGVRIPLTLSDPVPAPVPGSTPSPSTLWSVSDGLCSQSGAVSSAAVCSQWFSCKSPSFSPASNFTSLGVTGPGTYCGYTLSGVSYTGAASGIQAVSVSACPAGWANSSGVCVLNNAYEAVPDGKTDYKRTGQTFDKYAGDETSAFDAFLSRSTVSVSNDRITISGADQLSGAPQTVGVTNTADGGSVITASTQKVDSLGRTYTDVRDVTISPSGVVTAVQGSQQATYKTWNATTNNYTQISTPTSTYTPVQGATSEPIVFPSDYARVGEAAAAANQVNASLGPKLDKITETGADPSDPSIPGSAEFDQAFFNGTFNNLLGWQLPAHSSACPTSSFDWNGSTYQVNSHCQLVNDHFGLFSTVMMVIWTILALFILLAA